MTKIESEKVTVENSSEKIFTFLSNLNNFQKLMPAQVINWKSTENNCSFTIKGMTDISLCLGGLIPYTRIELIPNDKAPFNFSLESLFEKLNENKCTVQIVFNAELNAMMEMLARKPLQNFVNILADKLKELGDKL